MEKEKVDLSGPAFAPAQISHDSVEEEEHKAEETQENEGQGSEGTPETSVEENKVPYSRFKNIHERYKDTQREYQEYRAQTEAELERLRQGREERQTFEQSSETPDWWKKLYGDSPESKEGYRIFSQNMPRTLTKEEIRQEARQAYIEEQQQESQRVEGNLETLDDTLDDLGAYLGRDLTEKEQADVLDIMDEYTPKDDDGMYMGPLFSAEKAWEVYELRQRANQGTRKQERDSVASLTGTESHGEPGTSHTLDKDWDASRLQDFGNWRTRRKLPE